MADSTTPPAPGVPGVPAGSAPPTPVAANAAPVAGTGLPGPSQSVPKPLFGGNVGRKLRYDGLKSGSPEAIAADKLKNAERMRRARAEKSAATPPPALPPSATPVPTTPTTDFSAPGVGVASDSLDPVLQWTAEDFRQCAPELVELAEAWRISAHTKHAADGKLPRVVVDEIAKDAAFPPGSKKSLSTSSPVTLAKMFNALSVPITLKPIITMAPALVYIVVRDLMTGVRIDKLIADANKPKEPEPEPKK